MGECATCPAGTYQDAAGASSCTSCPDCSTSVFGSTSLTECSADRRRLATPGGKDMVAPERVLRKGTRFQNASKVKGQGIPSLPSLSHSVDHIEVRKGSSASAIPQGKVSTVSPPMSLSSTHLPARQRKLDPDGSRHKMLQQHRTDELAGRHSRRSLLSSAPPTARSTALASPVTVDDHTHWLCDRGSA